MRKHVLITLALVAALTALRAGADDKDLLRSSAAAPNVLVILDSAATMVQDPGNTQNLLASGDDEASKLTQAKDVLNWFIDAFPDFNMGFTFLEKKDVNVRYVDYVYQVAATDSTGLPQTGMLDGTQVGDDLRLGSSYDPWHSDAAPPIYPIRYGALGAQCYGVLLSSEGTVKARFPGYACDAAPPLPDNKSTWSLAAGDAFIKSYLLAYNESGKPKGVRAPYYYPAYDWTTLGSVPGGLAAPNLKAAMQQVVSDRATGLATWQAVALDLGIDVTNRLWQQQLHDALVITAGDDAGTFRPTVAQQVGDKSLRIQEEEYVAVSDGRDVVWGETMAATRITRLEYVQQFVIYDRPATDPDSSQVSSAAGTLTAVDWEAPGNDCSGYLDYTADNIPVVPIPPVDESSGDPQYDNRPLLRSFFQPQWAPVFFFPNAPLTEPRFMPNGREAWMPFTESVIAGGRRDLKKSLDEIQAYFENVVRAQNDPLAACRQSFVILISDGLENCASSTNPLCNQATQLGRIPINVFTVGYGDSVLFASQSFTCIAGNSGGQHTTASNREELKTKLSEIGRTIQERIAAFSAPAVPSVELATREKGYISTFFSVKDRSIWEGHLRGYLVDPNTGVVPKTCTLDVNDNELCFPDTSKALWDAGRILAEDYLNWNQRTLYFGTNNATAGAVPGTRQLFTRTSSTEVTLWNRIVEPDPPATSDTFTATDRGRLDQIVNFTRGDRATVDRNNDSVPDYMFPWESRENPDNPPAFAILGDIFHSVPVISGRPECFACYQYGMPGYVDYYNSNLWRRKVLLVGANDGSLHAFDAGFYAPPTTQDGVALPARYDDGTGEELWAWVPNAAMPKLDVMAEGTTQVYTVDGSPIVVDAYIDPVHGGTPTAADRQWRTLTLFGMRSGGSSVVALDLTRPDPYTEGVPISGSDRQPGCADDGAGCIGEYPRLLWEFTDAGVDVNGHPDLAETWSKPSVAMVKVRTGADADAESRFVAIFGGGYDSSHGGGDFLYMVDIETGKTLLKLQAGASVTGEVGILDVNFDGFAERIYWNDLAGNIWRMTLSSGGNPAVATVDGDGRVACTFSDANTATCSAWSVKKLFTPGLVAGYQPLFQRPLIVLAGYDATGAPVYAIGAGSGDREYILATNDPTDAYNPNPYHRFYMVLDPGNDTGLPYDETNLQPVGRDADAVLPGTSYLTAGGAVAGWYLILGTDEKVNTPAVALNDLVVFSTFTPARGAIALDADGDGEISAAERCFRRGNAKTYTVNYLNANPPPGETSRYIQFRDDVLMVSETIKYVGEDGKVHGLQTTDNTGMAEPVEAQAVGGALVSWRER